MTELKQQLTEKLVQVHEELQRVNDELITKQRLIIEKLQEQNKDLIGIIEKYLLGGKKFNEV
jgi:hypothetical protein